MTESLVVVSVVKNAGRRIRGVFRRLAGLALDFERLAFVVYENNSEDGTKEGLKALSRDLPNFRAIMEDLSQDDLLSAAKARHRSGAPCRIELIARARNIAREAALRDFGDYGLVLVFDPDALWFSLAGILRNAGRIAREEADAISANGLTKWLYYRDAFAFRSPRYPWGPEYLGESWWRSTKPRIQTRYFGKGLLPVFSAFGGAALYSMRAFATGRYAALVDEEFEKEQATYDSYLGKERGSGKAIPNSYYSLPVVCEHVPFNYALRRAGCGRQFVDPSWRLLFRD